MQGLLTPGNAGHGAMQGLLTPGNAGHGAMQANLAVTPCIPRAPDVLLQLARGGTVRRGGWAGAE
jgi:hypothetical protein